MIGTNQRTERQNSGNHPISTEKKNFWNFINCTNIHIIGRPRRRKEKRAENLFEGIIGENFPNLGKETDIQVQEAESPSKMHSVRSTPIYIII